MLLAGGKSRRMGTDKRVLILEGETLLTRALRVLEDLFPEVLVVLAERDHQISSESCKVVTDIIPHCATAGGLYTGLTYAQNEQVFVVACDMPFLNQKLIQFMAEEATDFDMTVGRLLQGIQPLHGFYRKTCLPFLETMIRNQDLKIQHLIENPGLAANILEESVLKENDRHLLSFMNVNTPSDMEMARKLVQA